MNLYLNFQCGIAMNWWLAQGVTCLRPAGIGSSRPTRPWVRGEVGIEDGWTIAHNLNVYNYNSFATLLTSWRHPSASLLEHDCFSLRLLPRKWKKLQRHRPQNTEGHHLPEVERQHTSQDQVRRARRVTITRSEGYLWHCVVHIVILFVILLFFLTSCFSCSSSSRTAGSTLHTLLTTLCV